MPESDGIGDRRGITGRHVLLMLVAFFAVIIAANAIFITVALKSFPGESQKKSYLQGIHYNDRLAERIVQDRLGWQAQITSVERNGDGAFIEMHLSDARNDPLRVLVSDAELRRPVHHHEDKQLSFRALGDGVYRSDIEALASGVWDLTAVAKNARDERFDIRARIIVP